MGGAKPLTCHVDSEGAVRSPAGVPAHHLSPRHQGALVLQTTGKSHRPNGDTLGCSHLQISGGGVAGWRGVWEGGRKSVEADDTLFYGTAALKFKKQSLS